MGRIATIERFVCPPWHECQCPLGLPVSRNTMLNHRRLANERRRKMGRGDFGWGPRAPDQTPALESMSDLFSFTEFESLEQRRTDCEDDSENDISDKPIHGTTTGSSGNDEDNENSFIQPDENYYACPNVSPHHSESSSSQLQSNCERIQTSGNNLNPVVESSNVGDDIDTASLHQSMILEEGNSLYPNDLDLEATTNIEGLVEWLTGNQVVVDLYVKHGLEYTVMDDILVLFGAPCRSWKTVVSYIFRASSLAQKVQTYPICPGHSCFAIPRGDNNRTSHCSSCGVARPETISSPAQSISYLPFVPRIAAIAREQATCKQLYAYRHTRESSEGIYADYFDGEAYLRLVNRYSEEAMKWDIFLAVSADGFQPFRNRQYDIWSIIGIMYNLPPTLRYATKNVIPLMYIPGPKEPKDLETFLIPLLNEIHDVHKSDGVQIRFYDGVTRRVRIHVIWFQGDTPAISKAAGLCGHKARHPCRSCEFEGVYVVASKGYYYPSKVSFFSPRNGPLVLYNSSQLPGRSIASVTDTFQRLDSCRNETQRSSIATATGIKRRSLLLDIPNFVAYKSFPHDTMHLMYNIQREILALLTGDIGAAFTLDAYSVDRIDNEIMDAGHTISGQLIQLRPKGVGKWNTWKAAEHR